MSLGFLLERSPSTVDARPTPARHPFAIVAIGLVIIACLGIYGFRLTLGTDLTDEAYYANLAISRLRLPEGDTGDNSPHQSFGLLLQPVVRLYSWFAPDFTGVMLYLRFVYGLMSLLTAAAVWTLLRRLLPFWTAVAVSLVPVAFIPFGLPAPSYNTVAMLGTIASLCLYGGYLVRRWTAQDDDESSQEAWLAPLVAGAICALSVIAYPTILVSALAFFPIAAFLAPSWKAARPLLLLLFFGVVFLLLGSGLVLGVFGLQKVQEILAFDRAIGQHKDWQQPAQAGWIQFTHHSAFPLYCILGAAITFLGKVVLRPGVRTVGAVGLLLLIVGVLKLPSPSFCVRGHDLVFFLVFIGLPILLDLRSPSTRSPGRRVLLILYCTGGVSGLLTAWTASHAMFNFPIGGLLAAVASLASLLLEPDQAPATERRHLILPVGSLGALAVCSFMTVYGHGTGNLAALKSVISTGPFAGLRTTKVQRAEIDQSRDQFQRWEGQCRTVSVVSPFAGLYLLTPLKPVTPCSYFHAFQPASWKWFEALAVEPTKLPDLIVDLPEGAPPDPAMDTFLVKHYQLLSSPGPTQMFLRRDLPAPALPCPFTLRFDRAPWGTGWSVPEAAPGGHLIWMAAREATIRLPKLEARGDLRLRIDVPSAMAPDILASLKLRVNGHLVPLTVVTAPTPLFEATLTPAVLANSATGIVLEFSVNRTIVPPGGDRTLAVRFRELVFSEVGR